MNQLWTSSSIFEAARDTFLDKDFTFSKTMEADDDCIKAITSEHVQRLKMVC